MKPGLSTKTIHPTGAFKARGAVTYIDWVKRQYPDARAIATATRGNHWTVPVNGGYQSRLAGKYLCFHLGIPVRKNAAMRAFGANLVEFGSDFDEARLEVTAKAEANSWHLVPSFHSELVRGVATYALELFYACSPSRYRLRTHWVWFRHFAGLSLPRDALGLNTKIVGVVSSEAQTAKLSFEQSKLVETNQACDFRRRYGGSCTGQGSARYI